MDAEMPLQPQKNHHVFEKWPCKKILIIVLSHMDLIEVDIYAGT